MCVSLQAALHVRRYLDLDETVLMESTAESANTGQPMGLEHCFTVKLSAKNYYNSNYIFTNVVCI